MKELIRLHRRLYSELKSNETVKDREKEFNLIINTYEINSVDIAIYLKKVRTTPKGRKTLIHKLLDHWGHGEAIFELSQRL